ncbi:hypothetical protein BI012_gp55 [Acinetobacter phage LZ35]|jgi:hypothetical protein|uniref:Uncharacterized protein n=1 Tax=Acinetobacter phage LZ35 TaxID=1792222 RepID=A0A190XCE6_9CAUD|nr:hypothetical protein BI012_gp55 [Acinetobacter phage LZ35]AMD43212.1 hypothetical protein YD_55 [Acinetobacter phage LZ35]
MNLIDRLGGYVEAKKQGEQWGFDDHLNKALLEYRRQNNIFEIGDLVVFKEEYSKDSVIHKIDSLRAGTKCLRHATDEEIEKGCRV